MADIEGISDDSILNIPDEIIPAKKEKKSVGRPVNSKEFYKAYRELQDWKNEESGDIKRDVYDLIYELEEIAFNRQHPQQFQALQIFLDRIYGKPKTQIEIEHNNNITNNTLIIDATEENAALIERIANKFKKEEPKQIIDVPAENPEKSN